MMLAYPNTLKEFHLHPDPSGYHIGAIMSQEGNSLGYFSRHSNKAQKTIRSLTRSSWKSLRASNISTKSSVGPKLRFSPTAIIWHAGTLHIHPRAFFARFFYKTRLQWVGQPWGRRTIPPWHWCEHIGKLKWRRCGYFHDTTKNRFRWNILCRPEAHQGYVGCWIGSNKDEIRPNVHGQGRNNNQPGNGIDILTREDLSTGGFLRGPYGMLP